MLRSSFPMSCCASRMLLADSSTPLRHHRISIIFKKLTYSKTDGSSTRYGQSLTTSCSRQGKDELDASQSVIFNLNNFKYLSFKNSSSPTYHLPFTWREFNNLRTSRFGSFPMADILCHCWLNLYNVIFFSVVGKLNGQGWAWKE